MYIIKKLYIWSYYQHVLHEIGSTPVRKHDTQLTKAAQWLEPFGRHDSQQGNSKGAEAQQSSALNILQDLGWLLKFSKPLHLWLMTKICKKNWHAKFWNIVQIHHNERISVHVVVLLHLKFRKSETTVELLATQGLLWSSLWLLAWVYCSTNLWKVNFSNIGHIYQSKVVSIIFSCACSFWEIFMQPIA